MGRRIYESGQQLRNVTLLRKVYRDEGPYRNRYGVWRMRCRCGKEFDGYPWQFSGGNQVSCGCYRGEMERDFEPRRVVLTNERNIELARLCLGDAADKIIDQRFGGEAEPHTPEELIPRSCLKLPSLADTALSEIFYNA